MNPELCEHCQQLLSASGMCARCLLEGALNPLLEEAPIQAGTQFGKYLLIQKIGSGGMGSVWKARQIGTSREVALKMLATHAAEPAAEHRFRAEAEAASSLEHPDIVPVYDLGEVDGQWYFTMKLMEGGTLAARSQSPPSMAFMEIAAMVEKLARAVHFAHQRGILHRDLKTANILLDTLGNAAVADFGLAHRLDGASRLTLTGAILGSPSTMAPEQAAAKGEPPTVGTDVYGIGTILYELLTGTPVFQGSNLLATIHAVVHDDPVPPSQRRPGLPRDLETICLRCLQKHPSKRYPDLVSLANDLACVRRGDPILARPSTYFEKLRRGIVRHPVATFIACSIPVFLGILAWQAFRYGQSITLQRDEARRYGQEAIISRNAAEQVSERLTENLYASEMQLAWDAYHGKNLSRTKQLLAKLATGPCYFDHRLLTLLTTDPSAVKVIRGFSSPPLLVAWANGPQRLYVAGDGYLEAHEIATDTRHRLLPGIWEPVNKLDAAAAQQLVLPFFPLPWDHRLFEMPTDTAGWGRVAKGYGPGSYDRLRVSIDGSFLATGLDGGWGQLRETATGRPLAGFPCKGADFSLNQDGTQFICGSTHPQNGKTAVIGNVAHKAPFFTLSTTGGLVAQSADGSVFVQGNDGKALHLWKQHESEPYAAIPVEYFIGDVAVAPNGHWGAFTEQGSWDIHFFDLRLAKLIATKAGNGSPITSIAISPDSDWLASVSEDNYLRVLPGPEATSTPQRSEWWGHTKTPQKVTFLQDRHHLATAAEDGTVRLWHVADTNEQPPQAPTAEFNRQQLLLAPQGRWLAGTQSSGQVRVADLNNHTTWQVPVESAATLGWSAAGELLLLHHETPVKLSRWPIGGTQPSSTTTLKNCPWPLGHFRLSPDGNWLIMAHLEKPAASLWNLSNGDLEGTDPMPGRLQNLAWSPDGKTIAGAVYGSHLMVARTEDGARLFTLKAPAPVRWLEFSPDGKLLVAADFHSRNISLFDAQTGQPKGELVGHTKSVCQTAITPDSKILASVGQDRTIRLWHLPTQRELTILATDATTERLCLDATSTRVIYINEKNQVISLPTQGF